jgi:hypothetical protein
MLVRALLQISIGVSLVAASPAWADQVHFTGQTTATPQLIKDTLQNILLFSHTTKKCDTLSAVESTILPKTYVPTDPKYRVGQPPIVYESWYATLCGEQTKFLISFWPSPEGGTMFSVGYPYPPDAP